MAAYITVEQGDKMYLDGMPVVIHYLTEDEDYELWDVWNDSNEDLKRRSLMEATRLIDSFQYGGKKTRESQDNQFPRDSMIGVPTDVKRACFALTLEILRRYWQRVYTEPMTQQYIDNQAYLVDIRIGNATERVRYERQQPLHVIAYPYLKKWVKGRFNVIARRAF